MTEHSPEPQAGHLFALESSCATCGDRILWRIGTAVWEHAPNPVLGRRVRHVMGSFKFRDPENLPTADEALGWLTMNYPNKPVSIWPHVFNYGHAELAHLPDGTIAPTEFTVNADGEGEDNWYELNHPGELP